jgi:predicted dehydrogenase
VARKKERVLRAFGARAYASLDFAAQKLEVLRLGMGPDGPTVLPDVIDIVEGEPLKLELEAFYAACLGQGEDLCPWQDAFEAMKVADMVQKSVAESLANLKID